MLKTIWSETSCVVHIACSPQMGSIYTNKKVEYNLLQIASGAYMKLQLQTEGGKF